MFTYERGILLQGAELWLDPPRIVANACVSHGHADHIKRHRQSFATPPTAAFMRQRLGRVQLTEVDFFKPFSFGPYRVTMLPAGHILGSAQIKVEFEGRLLIYSGDFKIEPNATAERIAIEPCDILITECTFGRPQYRFPKRAALEERLCSFVRRGLRNGETPIIYGYALGKAQEALKILTQNGFAVCAHGSIMQLAKIYAKFGITFAGARKFNAANFREGQVLVMPPQARKQRQIQRIAKQRTMFLSGWGMDERARYRYGVDEVLPLSDHADFDDLLEYVKRVNPRKVFTTHGPKDYYLYLREQGFDAHPLVPQKQGDLFV